MDVEAYNTCYIIKKVLHPDISRDTNDEFPFSKQIFKSSM